MHGVHLGSIALAAGEAGGSDPPPPAWVNPHSGSFDNIFSSMLILFVLTTGDAWEEFMWTAMDAVDVGIAPERNDHSLASIYFVPLG